MTIVTGMRRGRRLANFDAAAYKRRAHRAYRRWAKTRLRLEDPMLDAPPRTKILTCWDVC